MIKLKPISDSEVGVDYEDYRGIVRYSAHFHLQASGKLKVSNKLLYDERGMSVQYNASIPASILNLMRRRAYGFFHNIAKRQAIQ